jgi:hypothetical protein
VLPCQLTRLLQPNTVGTLTQALDRYPPSGDDIFVAVGARLRKHSAATKLDLAGLVFWKHIQNAPWMTTLTKAPEAEVQAETTAALAPDLTDARRMDI